MNAYNYGEAAISLNNESLRGVQSVSADVSLDSLDVKLIAERQNDKDLSGVSKIQQATFNVSYYANTDSYDPFSGAANIDNFMIELGNASAGYPSGSYAVENCFLQSANLRASVGEFMTYDITVVGDIISSGGGGSAVGQDADPWGPFINQPPPVARDRITVTGGEISGCIQGFSVTLNPNRKAIKSYGGAFIKRPPQLPITVDLDVTFLKGNFVDIFPAGFPDVRKLNYDQSISIVTQAGLSYSFTALAYKGLSESHSMGGRATTTVSFSAILD